MSVFIDKASLSEDQHGNQGKAASLLGGTGKALLNTELARADVGYRELAELLAKHGLKETEASIANKISRRTFSATFLLATLKAIEADGLRLENV
jgi:hypothetical protein